MKNGRSPPVLFMEQGIVSVFTMMEICDRIAESDLYLK